MFVRAQFYFTELHYKNFCFKLILQSLFGNRKLVKSFLGMVYICYVKACAEMEMGNLLLARQVNILL